MIRHARIFFDRFLSLLGFKSYIKVPGKGFSDLSKDDVASMIDAFLEDGNEAFEQNALYEFRLMKYPQEHLEKARRRIDAIQHKHRSAAQPDGLITPEGQSELQLLSQELRSK